GAERAGRDLQRVDLGDGPLPGGDAVVEADVAPPLLTGEDRHDRGREDALLREVDGLLATEILREAADDLPVAEGLRPRLVALLVGPVLVPLVVDRGADPVGTPFEAAAHQQLAVGPRVVLEDVDAARVGRDSD